MLNILIVEDEQAIANLIYVNLSDEGYRCTCAFDGKQGADFIEGMHYNLLSRLSFELNGLTAFFAEDSTLVYSELPAQTDFSLIERTGLDYHIMRITS